MEISRPQRCFLRPEVPPSDEGSMRVLTMDQKERATCLNSAAMLALRGHHPEFRAVGLPEAATEKSFRPDVPARMVD